MIRIVEEVPGIEEYRWFVSCAETTKDDPVRKHFEGKVTIGHCDTLDEAKAWCDERGITYVIERFDY